MYIICCFGVIIKNRNEIKHVSVILILYWCPLQILYDDSGEESCLGPIP